MSLAIEFASLESAQRWALELALNTGRAVSPRGILTREISPAAFTLTNPRRRIITTSARKWSLPLAIGEFCWHLSGSSDVEALAYYAPRWREFAEPNGRVQGSCYGAKIFRSDDNKPNQWDLVIQLLKDDPHSRRAILTFGDPLTEHSSLSVDLACTISLQFLIRDNKLHAITYMRSNDIILGLPYDLFIFTMLQEMMVKILQVDLGQYHHFIGSLHLYDRHLQLASSILNTPITDSFEMPEMGDLSVIQNFVEAEKQIRGGLKSRTTLPAYWEDLILVLTVFSSKNVAVSKANNLIYWPFIAHLF
jgi:thymidylate synthase